jgi:hypothetical protein
MFAEDVSYALYGAWRLARFDASGAGFFDTSRRGVVCSFLAAAASFPLFFVFVALGLDSETLGQAGLGRLFVVQAISYTAQCAAWPLATLFLARLFGREREWLGFVVANNWAGLLGLALIVFCAALAASGALPEALGNLLFVAASLAVLCYGWFVARAALDISGWRAALILFAQMLVQTPIDQVAYAIS